MSRAVLISIRPEWVEKIGEGKKTIEVRRTRPKLQPPFKCYIYCTLPRKNKSHVMFLSICDDGEIREMNGKVVGEFVCDQITWLTHIGFTGFPGNKLVAMKSYYMVNNSFDFSDSCLTIDQIEKYLDGGDGYAWHISDLKIYETPKELPEFHTWKKCKSCSKSGYESTACIYDENCIVPAVITKAPQSWCYVEELR